MNGKLIEYQWKLVKRSSKKMILKLIILGDIILCIHLIVKLVLCFSFMMDIARSTYFLISISNTRTL